MVLQHQLIKIYDMFGIAKEFGIAFGMHCMDGIIVSSGGHFHSDEL